MHFLSGGAILAQSLTPSSQHSQCDSDWTPDQGQLNTRQCVNTLRGGIYAPAAGCKVTLLPFIER